MTGDPERHDAAGSMAGQARRHLATYAWCA